MLLGRIIVVVIMSCHQSLTYLVATRRLGEGSNMDQNHTIMHPDTVEEGSFLSMQQQYNNVSVAQYVTIRNVHTSFVFLHKLFLSRLLLYCTDSFVHFMDSYSNPFNSTRLNSFYSCFCFGVIVCARTDTAHSLDRDSHGNLPRPLWTRSSQCIGNLVSGVSFSSHNFKKQANKFFPTCLICICFLCMNVLYLIVVHFLYFQGHHGRQ